MPARTRTGKIGFRHLIMEDCTSILAAQCSCPSVESRDRACESEPPTRWKLVRVFIPCQYLDSPDRAGRLPTRALRLMRTHCRHLNTKRA